MLVDTADMGEEYSGEEDGDESEEAYIRDAFLAELFVCLNSSKSRSSWAS
jgi:hypothetical protein